MFTTYRKGQERRVRCNECGTDHRLLAPDYRFIPGAMGPTTPWCYCDAQREAYRR